MTNGKEKGTIGAPGRTYIKQVYFEQLLGRAINAERDSRPTTWGTFAEKRAFELLPISYKLVNDQRWRHPSLPWSGSPDLMHGLRANGDVKSPYSLQVFCEKLEALKSLDTYKAEYPEDYWQHVSNAVLLDVNGFSIDYCEPVIYCPFKSELDEIRTMANQYSGDDQYRFKWIGFALDEELPYILDGGNFTNLNIFRFEIPKDDKLALLNRVELATSALNEMKPELIPA